MRITLRLIPLLALLPFATNAAETTPPARLTVELRDGSRVVGASVEEHFRFRSALLGDIRLDPKEVRSLQCASTNTARLTTVKGDTLTVSFVDPTLALNTSFGSVKLAVDSIRSFTVAVPSPLGARREGLVALWSGEGDGHDSAGGNSALLKDISFADGRVGQAFAFNGTASSLRVPASPALDVGKADGFTLMAWIKPTEVEGLHPILQWSGDGALDLWIGIRPFEDGVLRGVVGNEVGNRFLCSEPNTVKAGVFQHIAFTYDKSSGMGVLYLNGVIVARRQFSRQIMSDTKGDLGISPRDDRPGHWSTGRMFAGLMDEIAIYNRALSAEEIGGICADENQGEPLTKPVPSSGWFESWMR